MRKVDSEKGGRFICGENGGRPRFINDPKPWSVPTFHSELLHYYRDPVWSKSPQCEVRAGRNRRNSFIMDV